jgi:hypothetical protein
MNDLELIKFVEEDHILALQKQIFKDFESSTNHFPPDFQEKKYTLEDIRFIIQENLSEILEMKESKTLQLCYKVDLPEAQFLCLISSENPIENLCNAILFREAHKISFRAKYSMR